MKSKSQKVLKVSVVALTVSALFSGGAWAQEKIEEVVVTAQKREQKVQDVPISITAITAQSIEDRAIESVQDLNGLVPNLNVNNVPVTGLTIAASLRGLGQGQPAIWADPAVGVYVDGAFVGKNTGAMLDVIDLERIEVLRGPQGTLFGRNTLAGAINFISRKPLGELSLTANTEVGNYGARSVKVGLELPKAGIVSIGMAVKREQRDGYIDNLTVGATDDFGNRDRTSARLSAKFDISKDAVLNYGFDYTDIDEMPMAGSLTSSKIASSAGFGTAGFSQYPGNNASIANPEFPTSLTYAPGFEYFQRVKVKGHRVLFDLKLNASNTLKYIGSRRDMDYADFSDYGGGFKGGANFPPQFGIAAPNTPMYVGGQDTTYENTSHEVQLVGSTKSTRYVLGYYTFEETGDVATTNFGVLLKATPTLKQSFTAVEYGIKTEASGLFGQVDFDISPQLTATAGLRYTKEEKSGYGRTFIGDSFGTRAFGPVATGAPSGDFSKTTPVAALAYKADADTNFYARYAVGYRSGGFSVQSGVPTDRYEAEIAKSFEVGVKRVLDGGRAIVNGAVFTTTLDDAQQSVLPVGTTTPKFLNAAEASIRGFELDGTVRVSKDWLVGFGYGFLQADFDSFLNAGVDIADKITYPNAPKHTLNVNFSGDLGRTSAGKLKLTGDATYKDSFYNIVAAPASAALSFNAEEIARMKSMLTINGKLALSDIKLGSGNARGEAYVWVKNALNKRQEVANMSLGFLTSFWSEPRTIGAGFTVKFD
ncbi:CirA Outer membrane receptor proteins, mostly Fe transport [Burkholderiales bacterium]